MRNVKLPLLFFLLFALSSIGHSDDVRVTLSENAAVIENTAVSMSVDLLNGRYSGYDKIESVVMFKEAAFLLDPGITRTISGGVSLTRSVPRRITPSGPSSGSEL